MNFIVYENKEFFARKELDMKENVKGMKNKKTFEFGYTKGFAKVRLVAIALMIMSVVLLVISFLPSYSETELYDKILRLHVIANSDDDADQQLKLAVRDGVLEYSKTFGGDINEITDACSIYSSHLDDVKEVAERIIEEAGYNYTVTVSLTKEYYPVRSYDDVSLPAGEYFSLRVIIGEGEGKNWWCVLYPPLCLSAAKADRELIEAGFTGDQIRIITENDGSVRYNVKFKLLESFKSFFDLFKK